jgi:hypothetical protein
MTWLGTGEDFDDESPIIFAREEYKERVILGIDRFSVETMIVTIDFPQRVEHEVNKQAMRDVTAAPSMTCLSCWVRERGFQTSKHR